MLNTENMEYNTTRNFLVMREYGRHIQKMVEYLLSIEDREERQRNAYAVIELMGFLNPHLKNVEDFRHKLWDHLFLISDFKLDVESPYPIPTRETLKAKPERLRYPKRYPKFNHLGKNIEVVIDKALKEENPEKKQGFANAVAYYMKLTYSNWHKELVHDDNIQTELSAMTKGELEFNNRPFVKHRVDIREENDYGKRPAGGYRKNLAAAAEITGMPGAEIITTEILVPVTEITEAEAGAATGITAAATAAVTAIIITAILRRDISKIITRINRITRIIKYLI